jgi:hypothetical protein
MRIFRDKLKACRRTYMPFRFLIFALVLSLVSCDELVEVTAPETELVRPSVFTNDATALSALTGVYIKLANSSSFAAGGFGSITMLIGAYSDELVSYASTGSAIHPFYFNNLSSQTTTVSSIWTSSYNIIYSVNAVIEGLDNSDGVSQSAKQQLKGEALFIRAFTHFYLASLYGDVPYIKTTDYRTNAKVKRTPAEEVYQFAIADLLDAKSLMSDSYPTGTRIRPNKGAAIALLARTYLYNGQWAQAEAQATEIINNTSQYALLSDLKTVFLANSQEAIWQLIPEYRYTNEGSLFILLAPPTYVTLRSNFISAFEPGDLRKQNWVDSLASISGLTKWYYAFKYKEKVNPTGNEYSMVFRLAEQYLIRAEARAQQENLTGDNSAESDVNIIRSRAGLTGTTPSTKDQLLEVIEKERRTELFTEWGHRFFDLKRWDRLNTVLLTVKPNWNSDDALLPIPRSEILSNTNFTQNHGY